MFGEFDETLNKILKSMRTKNKLDIILRSLEKFKLMNTALEQNNYLLRLKQVIL